MYRSLKSCTQSTRLLCFQESPRSLLTSCVLNGALRSSRSSLFSIFPSALYMYILLLLFSHRVSLSPFAPFCSIPVLATAILSDWLCCIYIYIHIYKSLFPSSFTPLQSTVPNGENQSSDDPLT